MCVNKDIPAGVFEYRVCRVLCWLCMSGKTQIPEAAKERDIYTVVTKDFFMETDEKLPELRRTPMRHQPHLLICSSICLTNKDSPPAWGSGS